MSMEYKYINKNAKSTIVMFHGTGGDENDLLFLGETIDPTANLLGLRGRINEYGMNRFFKRIKPGVFDEENLKSESKYISLFLEHFAKLNQLDIKDMVLIGFSNGANMIASLIYLYGKKYSANILLHPMLPYQDIEPVEQEDNLIMITAGTNDPLVPIAQALELKDTLVKYHSNVEIYQYPYGHQLSEKEITDIKRFYQKKVKKS